MKGVFWWFGSYVDKLFWSYLVCVFCFRDDVVGRVKLGGLK